MNADVTGWHSAYFLRLDDDGAGTGDATYYQGNREHVLEVSSTVDQTIYVTANTWHSRAYPRACRAEAAEERRAGTRNYAVISDSRQALAWGYGARHLEPL